jgi:hypothetical protein
LELLKELPAEVERYPLSADLRYKWSHELCNAHAKLLEALASIGSECEVDRLGCLTSWIAAGSLPVASVSGEFTRLMGNLSTSDAGEEYWKEALGLLEEACSSPTLDESSSLALMQLLLQLEQAFGNDDLKDGLVRVYVAFAESHHDDLFMGLLPRASEQHRQMCLKFAQLLLRISADEDEEIAGMALNSWHLLHDLAIDEGLPPSQVIASIFASLAQAILGNAKSASAQAKRDLGDALLCCWRVLGEEGLYPVLMTHSATDIEVVLWAFEAVSEEVGRYHPLIGELLSSLPSMASLSPAVRGLAIRLLGKFAHLLVAQPEHARLLHSSVDLLLGEIGATGSLEAARAIHQVNEDCAGILANRLDTLLQLMKSVGNEPALLLLCKTFGQVISDLPLALRLELVSAAAPSLRQPAPLTALIRATNLASESAEELAHCGGLVGLFADAEQLIIDGDGRPDEAWNELFEALVISCGPEAFHLAVPALERLHASLLASPDPMGLSTLTTALCIYGKGHPELLAQTLSPLLDAVKLTDPADEDAIQATLDLLSKVSAKHLTSLFADQQIEGHFGRLLWYISQRIGSGGTLSTPFLRAILRFHMTLLNAADEAAMRWVDSLYQQHGKPLLTALIYAAANTLPRSQLDTASKLLFEVSHRFPQPSRLWTASALSAADFPSPSYSPAEKAALATGLAAARSVAKTRQLIADFCALNKQQQF